MDILKVKPWGKNQGEYVVIEAKDFDPAKHELFGAKEPEAHLEEEKPARRGRRKSQ